MLTQAEKKKLDAKLAQVKTAQVKELEEYIDRRHLNKEGDANWQKYVKKCLTWFAKYQDVEYRRFRVMYIQALYDLRKGKKSPLINI